MLSIVWDGFVLYAKWPAQYIFKSCKDVPSFIFNQNLPFWYTENDPTNPVQSSKCVPTHAFYPNPPFFCTENICEIMHVSPNKKFKQSLWCERRNVLALVEVFLPYRDSIYRFAVLWKIQILSIFLFIWEYWLSDCGN